MTTPKWRAHQREDNAFRTAESMMDTFNLWAKHDPDKCRLDPDGPAVKAHAFGVAWSDVLHAPAKWFALVESIERRDLSWDAGREDDGTYTASVRSDTVHTCATNHHHAAAALLDAYTMWLEEAA